MCHCVRVFPTGVFVSQPHNLGDVKQLGIRSWGSLSIDSRITINPSVSIYQYKTHPNRLAREHSIEGKQGIGFNSSLSSLAKIGKGLTLSATLQLFTPIFNVQSNHFEDATYFLALEKEFKQGIKIGVVSALPFSKNFTYFGETVKTKDLSSYYAGNIEKLLIPFWFRITYNFSAGKRKESLKREYEDTETLPRKGF